MLLPNPETVDPAELAKALAVAANEIVRTDGDRDEDNGSNLTVEQTIAAAKLMRLAVFKLTGQN
jgi:hypothetical protein